MTRSIAAEVHDALRRELQAAADSQFMSVREVAETWAKTRGEEHFSEKSQLAVTLEVAQRRGRLSDFTTQLGEDFQQGLAASQEAAVSDNLVSTMGAYPYTATIKTTSVAAAVTGACVANAGSAWPPTGLKTHAAFSSSMQEAEEEGGGEVEDGKRRRHGRFIRL